MTNAPSGYVSGDQRGDNVEPMDDDICKETCNNMAECLAYEYGNSGGNECRLYAGPHYAPLPAPGTNGRAWTFYTKNEWPQTASSGDWSVPMVTDMTGTSSLCYIKAYSGGYTNLGAGSCTGTPTSAGGAQWPSAYWITSSQANYEVTEAVCKTHCDQKQECMSYDFRASDQACHLRVWPASTNTMGDLFTLDQADSFPLVTHTDGDSDRTCYVKDSAVRTKKLINLGSCKNGAAIIAAGNGRYDAIAAAETVDVGKTTEQVCQERCDVAGPGMTWDIPGGVCNYFSATNNSAGTSGCSLLHISDWEKSGLYAGCTSDDTTCCFLYGWVGCSDDFSQCWMAYKYTPGQASSYWVHSVQGETCGHGGVQVTTQHECQAAKIALDLRWNTNWFTVTNRSNVEEVTDATRQTVSDAGRIPFCHKHTDDGMDFNTDLTGKNSGYTGLTGYAICKNEVQIVGP